MNGEETAKVDRAQGMIGVKGWKKELVCGIKDGIPIAMGYFAVSFSLGIAMVSAGLSAVQGMVMSITNVTSAGEFAACVAVIAKMEPGAELGHWPKIRALLNQHCGYHLAEDEIILLFIGGVAYYIRDILLRISGSKTH